MPSSKEQHTFISYSRTNMDFTLRLARELKASGFPVWVDQLDIPVGARWDDEVEAALDACGIFMVILTPASIASNSVKDEIGYAIDSGKRMLPVLLEQCNVPLRLRRFQHVDFTSMSYEEGVEKAKQLLTNYIRESKPPKSLMIAIQDQESQANIERKAEEHESSPEQKSGVHPESIKDQASIATQKGRKEELELKAKEEQERLSVQRAEEQRLASQEMEIEHKASPPVVHIRNESVWGFGGKEVLRGLIGIILYSITSIVFRQVTNSGFLIFFAIAYGPWVGIAIGFLGSLIADIFSSNPINYLYYGLIGMIAGLATRKIVNFRDYRDILKAIGLGELGAIAGFILFGAIPSAIGIVGINAQLITLGISLISNVIFLPILMIIFANVVGRSEKSAQERPVANFDNRMLWIGVGVVIAVIVIVCICVALYLYIASN